MKIFWKCDCGNVNRFENNDYIVFTFEQKEQDLGYDRCAKCNKEHDFELTLTIRDQS